MKRRDFLKTSAVAGLALVGAGRVAETKPPDQSWAEEFGRNICMISLTIKDSPKCLCFDYHWGAIYTTRSDWDVYKDLVRNKSVLTFRTAAAEWGEVTGFKLSFELDAEYHELDVQMAQQRHVSKGDTAQFDRHNIGLGLGYPGVEHFARWIEGAS